MTDLTPMIRAVQQAAELCSRVQAVSLATSTKGDDSPVTIADYGAQALICRAIAHHYPEDAVIAEESSRGFTSLLSDSSRARVVELVSSIIYDDVSEDDLVRWLEYGHNTDKRGRTWVIDPIDGTVGFVRGRYYAICVALMHGYQPNEAVIGLPKSPLDSLGTILYTRPDGLTAMDLYGDNVRTVRASRRSKPSEMRILESIKLPQEDIDLNAELRELAGITSIQTQLYDSQIKYAMIAAGYGDIFVRLPRDITHEPHYIWDHATGAALMRSGGAKLTDLRGRPLDFSQGEALPHYGFIATNGSFHDELIQAIKSRLGSQYPL